MLGVRWINDDSIMKAVIEVHLNDVLIERFEEYVNIKLLVSCIDC